MKARIKMDLSIFIGVSVLLSCGAAAFTASVIKDRQTDELRTYIKTLEDDRARLTRENVLLKVRKAAIEPPIVVVAENATSAETAQVGTAEKSSSIVSETESVEEIPVQANAENYIGVPLGVATNFMPAEPYDRFHPASEQYKLQQVCETDPETGIRVYQGAYCVALGGAYGHEIGSVYRVTLNCGTVFDVILADFKHPINDPDAADDYGDVCRNYDDELCIAVIEFVADFWSTPYESAMPDIVLQAGTYTALERFGGLSGDGGYIVKIEYLGRRWKP